MSKKINTNPYKINQYTAPDPRQSLFLESYLNPKSPTFSNAYKSAIQAGYSTSYAVAILGKETEWLAENVNRRQRLLNKAESNLEILTESRNETIKADITKFIAKTLGKAHYSERTEHTGRDGKDLIPIPIMELTKIKISPPQSQAVPASS